MIKKFSTLIIIMVPLCILTGCVQQFRYNVKQVESDIIGLNRTVSVYSVDGKLVKTVNGRFKMLYPASNRIEFIDNTGRKTTITGIYTTIIEEK